MTVCVLSVILSRSYTRKILTHPPPLLIIPPSIRPPLVWWHEATAEVPATCPVEWVPSEHPLFILYTSGSTGKPKGKERGKDEEIQPNANTVYMQLV